MEMNSFWEEKAAKFAGEKGCKNNEEQKEHMFLEESLDDLSQMCV